MRKKPIRKRPTITLTLDPATLDFCTTVSSIYNISMSATVDGLLKIASKDLGIIQEYFKNSLTIIKQ